MNEYEQIEMASQLFKWDDIKNGNGWGRIFHKGQCSLFDYNRGFYYISIYVLHDYSNKGKFSTRVWYGTIDDGDFGGWYTNLTEKDAKYIAKEIKDVYSKLISIPSDFEMNKLLEHTGMKIGYE